LTGQPLKEKRNVLVESARIARGKVKDIKELKADEYDAVFFPGGFGAAKNLSDYASKSADLTVDKEVERVLLDFYKNNRPIGLACISPVLAAKVFGGNKKALHLTVGGKGDKWPYQGTIGIYFL
jgi:enhancing lycopene biosynthesis protein 2